MPVLRAVGASQPCRRCACRRPRASGASSACELAFSHFGADSDSTEGDSTPLDSTDAIFVVVEDPLTSLLYFIVQY